MLLYGAVNWASVVMYRENCLRSDKSLYTLGFFFKKNVRLKNALQNLRTC